MTQLGSEYLQLVNTIVPGPQSISYFLPLILLPTSLLVPPRILSHHALATLVTPIILAATIHAWICMRGVDVISVDTLWWSLFFLVFRSPREKFKRLVDENPQLLTRDAHDLSGLGEDIYPASLPARTRWVLELLSNRPLTSWKTGDLSHDSKVLRPYVRQSRQRFIWDIILVLLPVVFIFLPLSLLIKDNDPFFSRAGQPLTMPLVEYATPPLPVTISQRLFPTVLLRPLTVGMYLYSLMTLLFLPPFLLPVLATYITNTPDAKWSPHTWPRPHFGPFSSVLEHGLRGLWGTWWHQQMRHAVSEPGRWLASKLELRHGGLARYSAICISAFTLSGITHAGLVPPDPRSAEVHDPWSLRFMVAAFFWVQPVGILLEAQLIDPAITMLLASFPRSWSTVYIAGSLRLCWVLAFMSLSLTFLLDPLLELGYWHILDRFALRV